MAYYRSPGLIGIEFKFGRNNIHLNEIKIYVVRGAHTTLYFRQDDFERMSNENINISKKINKIMASYITFNKQK